MPWKVPAKLKQEQKLSGMASVAYEVEVVAHAILRDVVVRFSTNEYHYSEASPGPIGYGQASSVIAPGIGSL